MVDAERNERKSCDKRKKIKKIFVNSSEYCTFASDFE